MFRFAAQKCSDFVPEEEKSPLKNCCAKEFSKGQEYTVGAHIVPNGIKLISTFSCTAPLHSIQ